MSAYIKVIEDTDLEILQKYLENDGVVLIHKNIATQMEKELACSVDGEFLHDYDFGGEPDKYVDIISNDRHYAYHTILEKCKMHGQGRQSQS